MDGFLERLISDPAHWALAVALWGWVGERHARGADAKRMTAVLDKLTSALIRLAGGH